VELLKESEQNLYISFSDDGHVVIIVIIIKYITSSLSFSVVPNKTSVKCGVCENGFMHDVKSLVH
jgi:hypothetical protein